MGSFKNKLLFSYIMYGIALTIVAAFTMYTINESNIKSMNKEHRAKEFIIQKTYSLFLLTR